MSAAELLQTIGWICLAIAMLLALPYLLYLRLRGREFEFSYKGAIALVRAWLPIGIDLGWTLGAFLSEEPINWLDRRGDSFPLAYALPMTCVGLYFLYRYYRPER